MKRISPAVAVAAVALFATASAAHAREVYVPDFFADAVHVLDAATGQQIGAPIEVGPESNPYTLAISPDGATVYVVNEGEERVDVVDARTKTVVGSIPVGQQPFGIAISPDGSRGFVSNTGDQTVTAIDLLSKQPIGSPIPVGLNAYGIAASADGARVFVTNSGDGTVTVIDARTLQVIGLPIPVGENPYGLAVTPDGSRVLVANNDEATISVIDAKALTPIGAPIPVGNDPSGIAVSRDGSRAYVGNYGSGTVSVIDLATSQVVTTIPGFLQPQFVALTPSGAAGFVSEDEGTAGFNAGTNLGTGTLVPMEGAGHLAVVPDQSPTAALALPKRIRPGLAASFSGAGSSDPDGTVAGYAWSIAGGAPAAGGATFNHTFAKPGKSTVTLTVTDNEGCSVATVFTGQTASCSGNPAATITQTVTVAYPGVKAKCPKRASLGCKVTMQAVKWQGKGKKRKLVPQSAKAKAKLKAGASKTIALKPKKNARRKLAAAKKILVLETRIASSKGGEATARVRVVKLKVAA